MCKNRPDLRTMRMQNRNSVHIAALKTALLKLFHNMTYDNGESRLLRNLVFMFLCYLKPFTKGKMVCFSLRNMTIL